VRDDNPITEQVPSIAGLVRPAEATFSAHDRDVLAAYWHPVAYASEVADRPLSRRLLDVRLVVFRGEHGVCVARDLCAHRGSSLSRGRMDGCTLVCAYHGFRYADDGACIGIPAQDPSIPISGKLRLQTFPAVVAQGLVWTCLRPPAAAPPPAWPELPMEGWQTMEMPVAVWKVAATRQVENFNDVAHLSFVHVGTFGNRDAQRLNDYTVKEHGDGLEFTLRYPQVDRDTLAQAAEVISDMTYVYRLTVPFSTLLSIIAPDGRILNVYDVATPETARTSRIHMLLSRNYSTGDPTAPAIEFQSYVNNEDRPVVEDQYPEDLPLDLREEVHIGADRMSIAYRKRLKAIGLSGVWIA
jgi:phenylpropionate dioxygenase-like ring-hydroxylating dioxygenase large terminal subunit